MTELPEAIFRKWGHSFEEDADNITVYRPSEFNFPRARGRAGIEFKADGAFIDWTIGPVDAQSPIPGYWRVEDDSRVLVTYEGARRAPRRLEIVQCDDTMLKVEWQV